MKYGASVEYRYSIGVSYLPLSVEHRNTDRSYLPHTICAPESDTQSESNQCRLVLLS